MARNWSNYFFDTMGGEGGVCVKGQGLISRTFPGQFVFVFLLIQFEMSTVVHKSSSFALLNRSVVKTRSFVCEGSNGTGPQSNNKHQYLKGQRRVLKL